MPQYPHITNSSVAQDVAEDLTMNRFHMQILPPAGVPIVPWLSQEIKTIGGLDVIDKIPELSKQNSRGHTRNFLGAFIDDQSLELSITFNLNAHGENANDIVIYRMFRAWAQKGRNPHTGETGLKRNYIGSIILEQHNAIGEVWRKIDGSKVILSGISGLDEASLEAGDPVELSVTLVVEEPEIELFGEVK